MYETKLFRLVRESTGELAPKRVKTLLSSLLESEELEHLSLASTGTGSTALYFTPDSQRLVLGLTNLNAVIVALPKEDGEGDVRVTECFKPLVSDGSRTTVGLTRRQQKKLAKEAKERAGAANGDANGDVEMADEAGDAQGGEKETNEDEDVPETDSKSTSTPGAWISCIAASEDGQWLATADLLGRVAIYNLDTMRVSQMSLLKGCNSDNSYMSCFRPCPTLHPPLPSHPLTPPSWASLPRLARCNSITSSHAVLFLPRRSFTLSTRRSARNFLHSSRSRSSPSAAIPAHRAWSYGRMTGCARCSSTSR